MRDLVVRRFMRHRQAVMGLIVLAVLILAAILAPVITMDPDALSVSERKQGPSLTHPFGADEAGRDIFAIAPGLMIFLTVISINFVGDGLRDALDPYGRR